MLKATRMTGIKRLNPPNKLGHRRSTPHALILCLWLGGLRREEPLGRKVKSGLMFVGHRKEVYNEINEWNDDATSVRVAQEGR
jgi:hypothetical protein